MYVTVPIAMFGWPVVVLAMFALMPSRRAVVMSFLLAWLFLPIASFKVPGIPDYSKVTATVLGVVLGTLIFDLPRILALRPKWLDIPMLVWCLCPYASSIHNGLGVYDGCSAAFYQTLDWGIPYLIGRAYFGDFEGLRDLIVAIVMGGLIYVPLCLFEIKFSPQLHHWIYGYHQAPFTDAKRYGGYRPLVFMQNGLAVGLWMVEASIIAIWLWSTESLKRIWHMPVGAVAVLLFVTAVLCKSTGALCILLMGLTVLFIGRRFRSVLPVFCLVALVPGYISLRLDHAISPTEVGSVLSNYFEASRVKSFVFRMNNEEKLAARAFEQPLWGWGGWGRSAIHKKNGQYQTTTDSLWIIAFGKNGFVGLISLIVTLLLPASLAWYRHPPRHSSDIRLASLHLLSLILILFAIDCLSNAMINPIYILALGGVTTILMRPALQPALAPAAVRTRRYRSIASTGN